MATQDINFKLTATDRTTETIAKVRGSLGLLERKADDLRRSFGVGLAAQIGAALAPTVIAAFVVRVSRGVDALNDLKDATGASVENISALEDVAERTGTSFEAVGTSLVKFNQALSDAKPGSAASEVLKGLGLDAQRLKELDPAEALRQTAVALSRFADDGNKARAVQELFGRSLREVAPFLADLAKQGKLVATVTKEQADEAERFTHNLDALAKNSKDAARALVGSLLPALNEYFLLINRIKSGPGVFTAIGEVLKGNVFSTAQQGFDFYKRSLDEIDAKIKRVGTDSQSSAFARLNAPKKLAELDAERLKVSQLLDVYRDLVNASGGGAGRGTGVDVALPKLKVPEKGAKEPKDQISEAQRALAGYVATLDRELDKTKQLSEEHQALNFLKGLGATGQIPQVRELVLQLAAQNDQLRDQAEIQKLAADAQKQYNQALDDLIASTPTAQVEKLVEMEERLNAAFREGKVPLQLYTEALAKLDKDIEALNEPIEETLTELSKFAEQAARNIQDALGDTLEQILGGHFENIGQLWVNLINKMIAQALAARLNEALFGTNLTGGLLGPAISAILPSFDVGSSYVPRDMVAMVHQGERIVPAEQNRNWGGMPASNVTVYVDGSVETARLQTLVAQGVRQGQTQLLTQLKAQGVL
jgi:hypothetical protein